MGYYHMVQLRLLGLYIGIVAAGEVDRNWFMGSVQEAWSKPWQGWVECPTEMVKCGAALITPNIAITAASCIGDDIVSVHFGDHNRSSTEESEQTFAVAETFVHPSFNATTSENDIALIRLNASAAIDNSTVDTIAILPEDRKTEKTLSKRCRTGGWGYTVNGYSNSSSDQSDTPLMDVVIRTSDETCSQAGAPSSTFCFASKRNRTGSVACKGDEGGAVVCRKRGDWVLAGVISGFNMPSGGCTTGLVKAATRIPSYYDWIVSITG